MSLAALDRRPANAFARALDENDRDREDRHDKHGAEGDDASAMAPLLRTAAVLREHGGRAPTPGADFRTALRQRLMEEGAALAATESTAALPGPRGSGRRSERETAPRTVRWRRRVAVAGTLVAVGAGGLGGVAYASSDALPGDMTYGIKRSIEDLRVSLAGSDEERGERYLKQAATRLDEAEELLSRDDGTPDPDTVRHLRRVLGDMREEADKGRDLLTDQYRKSGKPGPMRDLADFARDGSERMQRIEPQLPDELATERDQVRTLLTAIHEQVTPLTDDRTASGGPSGAADPRDGKASDGGATPRSGVSPAPGVSEAPGGGGESGPLLPRLLPQGPAGGGEPGGTPGSNPGGGADGGLLPALPDLPAPGGPGLTGGDDGLLPGLRIPLLESAEPKAAAETPPSAGADQAAGQSGSTRALSIPPLLPGLPGIGLNLSGDDPLLSGNGD